MDLMETRTTVLIMSHLIMSHLTTILIRLDLRLHQNRIIPIMTRASTDHIMDGEKHLFKEPKSGSFLLQKIVSQKP
jgi:hypothetical protein